MVTQAKLCDHVNDRFWPRFYEVSKSDNQCLIFFVESGCTRRLFRIVVVHVHVCVFHVCECKGISIFDTHCSFELEVNDFESNFVFFSALMPHCHLQGYCSTNISTSVVSPVAVYHPVNVACVLISIESVSYFFAVIVEHFLEFVCSHHAFFIIDDAIFVLIHFRRDTCSV